jgi:hypothetical protein
MSEPPDYSDPLYGIGALPQRPVGAAISGPARPYGRTPGVDAYPEAPAADAPWPVVAGEAPRTRRRGALGIVVAIAVVLLIGAGVSAAWLLVGPGARGDDTPQEAVDGFLTGVYQSHDASDAAGHVCERARDQGELGRIVSAVSQQDDAYPGAHTTWTTTTLSIAGRQATADVTVSLTTVNEQVANRSLTLELIDDRGWWVCDVQAD